MEVGGWALSLHNNSQEWPRPETGAVMGPLLNAILLEVPGSLGEPDDGSALCLGMAGPPKGLETWLSVAAVSEGLAPGSPGVKGQHFQLLLSQLPVWERKQKDPWQEMMVFFLQPLVCGERSMGWGIPIAGSPLLHPPHSSNPWSPGGDMGLLAVTANLTSPASLV